LTTILEHCKHLSKQIRLHVIMRKWLWWGCLDGEPMIN